MSFECSCKCRVSVDANDSEEAEEKALTCLEEGEDICEETECSCDCERIE